MLMLRCFDVSRVGTSELAHVDTVCLQVNNLAFRRIHTEELFLKAVCPNTLVVQAVKDALVATASLTGLQDAIYSTDGGLDVVAIF